MAHKLMHTLSAHNPLSFKGGANDPVSTTERGTDDEQTHLIWLLDNTATRASTEATATNPTDNAPTDAAPADGSAPPGTWSVELVAAFFAARSGEELTRAAAEVCKHLGLAEDAAERQTVRERVRPFFLAVLGGRDASVRFATGLPGGEASTAAPAAEVLGVDAGAPTTDAQGAGAPGAEHVHAHALAKSDAGGVSRSTLTLHGARSDGSIEKAHVVDGGAATCLSAHTTFAGATGWAVVSDIDDTIKITMTNSRTGILRTTFVDAPTPVPGQPDFYRYMAQKLDAPPFWYLSASPYNLYHFLHDFRDANYPPGTILLRNTSWHNVAAFLASFREDTHAYKVEHLEEIHKDFPRRSMVCLGDSTQSDPEAYGDTYRKYPGWIRKIFIRKVEHISEITDIMPGKSNEERNCAERFDKAFRDIPKDVWHVFEDPQELYAQIDALVASGPPAS